MQRPGKRRRRNEPDSAGLDWARSPGTAPAEATLKIQGVPATLFEGEFDPEDHLITWQGNPEGAEVDRFDGRLLLEDLNPVPDRSLPNLGVDEPDEAGLDEERYADLDPSREAEVAGLAGWYYPKAASSSEEEDTGDTASEMPSFSTGANAEPLSAVRYTYAPAGVEEVRPGDAPDATAREVALPDSEAAVAETAEPFQPWFPIPNHLTSPETQRAHKIMAQTAKFVRGAGRQSVFVLRVKQVGNPNFAFLDPGHPLHPYFQWLIDNPLPEVAPGASPAQDEGERQTGATDGKGRTKSGELKDSGNALGLLNSYGSDTPKSEGAGSAFSDARPDPSSADDPPPETPTPQSTAARPAPQLPQPPADVSAIIGKLVKFVQVNGPKLEASVREREKDNPRFAFLHPGHVYHHAYREQLIGALGKEQAVAILPPDKVLEPEEPDTEPRPENPASTWLAFNNAKAPIRAAVALPAFQEDATAAVPAPRPAAPQASGAAKTSGIRANPAFLRVARFPMTADRATGKEKPEAGSDSDDDTLPEPQDQRQGEAEVHRLTAAEDRGGGSLAKIKSVSTPSLPTSGEPEVGGGTGAAEVAEAAQDLEDVDEGQGSVSAAAAAADEARKAQRRRLAREMLAAKKQQEVSARLKLANKIINHRSAFLAEDEEPQNLGENPEPGEIVEAEEKPTRAPIPAPRELPKLEELLRAKRPAMAMQAFDGLEVLPQPKASERPKSKSKHSSIKRRRDSEANEEGSRREGSRRRAGGEEGESSDSEDRRDAGADRKSRREKKDKRKKSRREERSRGRDSESPERRGSRHKAHKHKAKEKGHRTAVRRDGSPEQVSSAVSAKDMEERIRAMLRGQA